MKTHERSAKTNITCWNSNVHHHPCKSEEAVKRMRTMQKQAQHVGKRVPSVPAAAENLGSECAWTEANS
eukprot:1248004-Pyramimonas_sp.AAC.1